MKNSSCPICPSSHSDVTEDVLDNVWDFPLSLSQKSSVVCSEVCSDFLIVARNFSSNDLGVESSLLNKGFLISFSFIDSSDVLSSLASDAVVTSLTGV